VGTNGGKKKDTNGKENIPWLGKKKTAKTKQRFIVPDKTPRPKASPSENGENVPQPKKSLDKKKKEERKERGGAVKTRGEGLWGRKALRKKKKTTLTDRGF